MPRAIFWRRRLLLLAAAILLAWAVLQVWTKFHHDEPVAEPSVTPSPTATTSAAPAPTPTPTPSATPVVTAPSDESTTQVALTGGGRACDPHRIRMTVDVADGQMARQPVRIDLSISTTSKQPCVFKPKTYDPLAVVSSGTKRVWDSSMCKTPVADGAVQVVPGWATAVQVPWIPRKSGKHCADNAAWLAAGEYTLEVGTLGGEPGKATFTLAEPPPTAEPPAPVPSPSASSPAPAPAEASPAAVPVEPMD